jgi:hypothetical protein
MMKKFTAAVLMILFAAAGAFAAPKPINLSSLANSTWCGDTLINCSTFPSGKKKFDAVPFDIPTANNAWFGDIAAGGGNSPVSVTIPVNVKNVQTVYVLMNSIWGSGTPGLATVTFTGSGGVSWTYDLVEGSDIRDYNNGNYFNTIDCALPSGLGQTVGTVGAVQAWSNGEGQRLDMQIFQLPASFAKTTLVSVTVNDNGGKNLQRMIVAAVSVSTKAP